MKNIENALLDKNKEPILGNINIDKFYDSEGGLDVGKNDAMNKDLNLGIEDGRVDSGTNDDNVLFIEDRISKCLESANNNLNVKQGQALMWKIKRACSCVIIAAINLLKSGLYQNTWITNTRVKVFCTSVFCAILYVLTGLV